MELNQVHYTNPHANGRVDLITPKMNQFELFKPPGVNYNEKTASFNEAITGEYEDNLLAKVFFHHQNIEIIQNGIRAGVYKKSNGQMNVGYQDPKTVKIIMRSIYMTHAQHNRNIDVTTQVQDLNDLVLDYCVKNVYDEAVAYEKYKRDISTLPMPNDRPENVSTRYHSVEFKNFFPN